MWPGFTPAVTKICAAKGLNLDHITEKKERLTLSDIFRFVFKGLLDKLGAFFNSLGIKPNTMTLLGVLGVAVGAYFVAIGELFWGGVIVALSGGIDALDGTMARLRGEPGEFGAYVDSVSDRYGDLLIMGGFLFYFLQEDNTLAVALSYLAAAGTVLVSYIRARAVILDLDVKVGLLTRFERIVVIVPALVLNLPFWGVLILALGTNLTAFQRILYVRREVHKK